MGKISRKKFLVQTGMVSTSIILGQGCNFIAKPDMAIPSEGVIIKTPLAGEDIFSYIARIRGKMEPPDYRSRKRIQGRGSDFGSLGRG